MIIGIGNDLIEINRINKIFLKNKIKFINHIFSPLEKIYIYKKFSQEASCAKKFSVKESFYV